MDGRADETDVFPDFTQFNVRKSKQLKDKTEI